MITVRKVARLRETVARWRAAGETIALVPTMGNLHRGHMSLVDLARERADRVVVCIFVNPTQFGPGEDFGAYPRTLERDRGRLRRGGADLLFVPDDREVYPFGPADMTTVCVPGLSTILCGAVRPGHFDGVTSVVCRLFNIVQADLAVFGQKDYQQLLIIRRMVADLHIPVAIVAGPTQREQDGLALSSRNQYLTRADRRRAPELQRALVACARRLAGGERDFGALEAAGRAHLEAAGLRADYFSIRSADDLSLPGPETAALVVLAAVRCGAARLIDNIILPASRPPVAGAA